MGKKNTIAIMILAWLCLSSCYESPHIDFHSFQELSEYKFIQNGWIPEIVGNDAFNIQETYDNRNHHVFGIFEYKNRLLYDSIMNSYEQVETVDLIAKIKEIKRPRYPTWFVPLEDLSGNHYLIVKHREFYLFRDRIANIIYFVR